MACKPLPPQTQQPMQIVSRTLAFDTAYRASTTRNALVIATLRIVLSNESEAKITMLTSTKDTGAPWQESGAVSVGLSASLVGLLQPLINAAVTHDQMVTFGVPMNNWYKIVAANIKGTPVKSIAGAQEILLSA